MSRTKLLTCAEHDQLMKDFLLQLFDRVAPENGAAQDAIECALLHGLITLPVDLDRSTADNLAAAERVVMENYDGIFDFYRKMQARHEALLTQTYGALELPAPIAVAA